MPAPAPKPPAPTPALPVADAGGKNTRLLAIAGAAVLVLAIGGSAGYFALRPDSVTVPDVAGLSKDEAVKKLRAVALVVALEIKEETRNVDGFDYPSVVRTDPAARAKSKKDGAVSIVISGMATVPPLTDVGATEARSKLNDLGFQNVKLEEKASEKEAGRVLSTVPPAGQRVARTEVVTLTVAAAKDTVPDLVGQVASKAEGVLATKNLKFKVEHDWRRGATLGTVVETRPAAGAKLNPGQEIAITVARRGGWVYLPGARPVVGKTLIVRSAGNLRDEPGGAKLGEVVGPQEEVRVLEVGSFDWVKVVTTRD